jgi:hypothetical protein
MSRACSLVVAILLVAASNIYAAADTKAAEKKSNPHLLKTRTTSVSVFKNGLGFFMREGTARKRDGWVMAEKIPPAKFGTLAIYSHNEKEHVDIVGSGPGEVVEFDGVDAADTLAARQTRLKAAEKLKLQLNYKENGTKRTAAGTLVSAGDKFAILDTGQQSIAVPIATVTRMQILAMPLRIHIEGDKKARSADTKVGIAYLSGGITWIPEYSVKILDDETAELTLRGTLVNEAEDLIHCDVNFVVGVPHFAHTQFMAPIAVGQVIRTIGAAVAPRQLQTQIMNRAGIVSNYNTSDQFKRQPVISKPAVAKTGNLKAATGNLPQINSAGGSDYTVYAKKDMTIRRGEKAIVTLFTKKIRYTHIYRWTPPARMRHLLQLHNDSDTAWTTGPYLAISGGRPLSEDLLKYTPKGGCAEIPVTAAINVASSRREHESDRKLKAHQPDKYKFWDLVTLSGKLKIRNFEKRPVEIVIDVNVPGKPIKASDKGELATDSTRLKLLERAGTVSWTITLKPGDDKTLTYSYERYIPTQ